jgi:hypothetical protein
LDWYGLGCERVDEGAGVEGVTMRPVSEKVNGKIVALSSTVIPRKRGRNRWRTDRDA